MGFGGFMRNLWDNFCDSGGWNVALSFFNRNKYFDLSVGSNRAGGACIPPWGGVDVGGCFPAWGINNSCFNPFSGGVLGQTNPALLGNLGGGPGLFQMPGWGLRF